MRYFNLIKNIDNWQEYLFYKFRITREDPLIFHCKNNVVVEVPIRLLHTFKEIFFEECYTKCLPKDRLKNDMTVIDVGANAGYFSLYMLSQYPGSQVIAFEPIPKNFELLMQNRRRNSMRNLTAVNKAVYSTIQKITLRYDARDSFTTTGSIFGRELGEDEIEVYTTTLPEIFETYALERVDLLKLDCEGAEYHILYNCPENCFKSITCIAMECHTGKNEDESRPAVCNFLRSLAYRTRIDKGGMVWAWREGLRTAAANVYKSSAV